MSFQLSSSLLDAPPGFILMWDRVALNPIDSLYYSFLSQSLALATFRV